MLLKVSLLAAHLSISAFKTKVTSRLAEYLSILLRYHHEERILKKFFLFLFSTKTFFSNFFFLMCQLIKSITKRFKHSSEFITTKQV